jgi:hypothetical protein
MDGLPYQCSITAPTGANMCACSIYLMSHAHDAHGEIDSLADLRDASRERLLTEIGMLRKETQFAEFQTLKAKYEREILASREAARQSMMKTLTWRVGSMVLKPLNLMKKLLRKS